MNLLSENSENRFKYDEHLNQQINHKILDRDWDENDVPLENPQKDWKMLTFELFIKSKNENMNP